MGRDPQWDGAAARQEGRSCGWTSFHHEAQVQTLSYSGHLIFSPMLRWSVFLWLFPSRNSPALDRLEVFFFPSKGHPPSKPSLPWVTSRTRAVSSEHPPLTSMSPGATGTFSPEHLKGKRGHQNKLSLKHGSFCYAGGAGAHLRS